MGVRLVQLQPPDGFGRSLISQLQSWRPSSRVRRGSPLPGHHSRRPGLPLHHRRRRHAPSLLSDHCSGMQGTEMTLLFHLYSPTRQLMYVWAVRRRNEEVAPPSYLEVSKPPSYSSCHPLNRGQGSDIDMSCLIIRDTLVLQVPAVRARKV